MMALPMPDESESFLINRWQRCHFELQNPSAGPHKKTDAVYGILQQLSQAKATGRIGDDVHSQLSRRYLKEHSSIVDSVNPKTGLNNYAEGALTLCSTHLNESSEWTTSFTSESLKELPSIKELRRVSQLSVESKKTAGPDQELVLNTAIHGINKDNSQSPLTGDPPTRNPLTRNPPTRDPITVTSGSTILPNPQDSPVVASYPYQSSATTSRPSGFTPQNETRYSPIVSQQNSFPSHQCPQNNLVFGTHGGTSRAYQRQLPTEMPCPVSAANPTRSTSFNPGARQGVFGVIGGQSQALKRKAAFQEVEAAGQVPLGTTIPQGAGFDEKRANDGQRVWQADDDGNCQGLPGAFKTANEQLNLNNQKKYGNRAAAPSCSGAYGTTKRSLGTTRRGLNSKFVPPIACRDEEPERGDSGRRRGVTTAGSKVTEGEEVIDERLRGIDPKMIELITNEIMDHGPPIHWDDIAGLEFAKTTIKEIVVWPMLRPDIFNGLRGPPKGLLLFGPPGTGKTLIGKCIACQSGATFFSISASSLTSKWVGEGEKMVRALFAVARCHQPAVIFIDEIDSLLSQRSNDEHESSRRIKTEFLVQLDGATTSSEDRLLVVGATNRPQEIDEAARRRLVKRLYIPLPEADARRQIVVSLLAGQSYSLAEEELNMICEETDGYSGADMANLCREAALGPIRCIQGTDIQHISADQVRPILYQDFNGALQHMRPSVSKADLDVYLDWNKTFGSGANKP